MPELRLHSFYSYLKLGISARDVHKWIDESWHTYPSLEHREYRHNIDSALKEIEKDRHDLIEKYGIDLIKEIILNHIKLDNETTEQRLIGKMYNKQRQKTRSHRRY